MKLAKEILLNFARFQNNDPESKYFGRIPNRAQPTGIIYNTTDGTPRFVIEILDYIRYSGDQSIIAEVYPVIKRSIEGSRKFWVDNDGYLTHEEEDTWMDAMKDGRPCSPRGNRANDIQSLWYQQLLASAWFAEVMEEQEIAHQWRELAEKLRENFNRDFFHDSFDYMADRLTATGETDFKLRPNQLYAFELLDDDLQKAHIAKKVWESLVYPWGVASLSQYDDDFHPYHEHWEYYHKDEAYHNGTVWLWNNGMAMQRLIEAGQKDVAYQLFRNINEMALRYGAVGSLSENADAIPLPGASRIRLTGAFLQAWSNAEQLRVWYQYFLGIRPDVLKNELYVNPCIPAAINRVDYQNKSRKRCFLFNYSAGTEVVTFEYISEGYEGKIILEVDDFPARDFQVKDQWKIVAAKKAGKLEIQVRETESIIDQVVLVPEDAKVEKRNQMEEVFKNAHFAVPYLNPDLKALRR